MTKGRVAVILATPDAGRASGDALEGFLREVRGRGEVVLVGPSMAIGPDRDPDLRAVHCPPGRLVPEQWRGGLVASDAEFVAFSTTQMVPRVGWLDALLGRLAETGAQGVGGTIAPGDRLGPVDLAVYLQRYLSYGPGAALPARPSGENALYRADDLRRAPGLWSGGFWEIEVQHRLESDGAIWAQAPEAVVSYHGPARLLPLSRQRAIHARRFGAIRAEGMGSIARRARIGSAPMVPAVLLARAIRGLGRRRMPIGPWLPALPSFLALSGAWAWGEALGFGDRSESRIHQTTSAVRTSD